MDHLDLDSLDDLQYIECGDVRRYTEDTSVNFHDFPRLVGWKINKNHGCEKLVDSPMPLLDFLQAWLFFGLLYTVLADSHPPNFDVYTIFTNGRYVSTRRLGDCLKTWEQFEKSQWERSVKSPQTKEAYSIRMVRIQMALDRARGVVKRNCTAEEVQPTDDEVPGPPPQDEKKFNRIALSLIILGETLSSAKAKIVDRVGFKIRGWHGDIAEGWGTSLLLQNKMRADWCPRTLHMLEGQFRENTTGLLAAYALRFFNGHNHEDYKCTPEVCNFHNVEDENLYTVEHNTSFCGHGSDQECLLDGPDLAQLKEIIKRGAIPLLLLEGQSDPGPNSTITVALTDSATHKDYATVSHVWSDGYGNPTSNRLHKCQLRYLKMILDRAQKEAGRDSKIPFWMDTLAIPVGAENKTERTISIGRIHEIFVKSRYTVIVDSGLGQTMAGTEYHKIAMKILASGWMRRLWTLQEAYLSERILFNFEDRALDLDALEAMFPDANANLNSNIPDIARSYFHSLLGIARKARIHNMTPREGLSLIASVWKATQWRTTTHKQHEVLALAALFDLNTGNSELNQTFTAKREDDKFLEDNMCLLLTLLEETYPGSIPAGMIFLPGRRLSKRGFGWAPRTWITARKTDFPDPLSLNTPTAKLVREVGLYVQFPGFLLHSTPTTHQTILMAEGGPLRFPSDSTLTEWYEITKADRHEDHDSQSTPGTYPSYKRYAIVLPRQRPRDTKEIALLVEVIRPQTQRSFHHKKETHILHVSVVFRIWVQRATMPDSAKIDELYGIGIAKEVFGEILDDDQRWYVDKRDGGMQTSNAGTSNLGDEDRRPGSTKPERTAPSGTASSKSKGKGSVPLSTKPGGTVSSPGPSTPKASTTGRGASRKIQDPHSLLRPTGVKRFGKSK